MTPLAARSLTRVPSVAHAFFTRQGGVSAGPFASLNCGFGSDDDKACVAENRRRAARQLGFDAERLVTPFQFHSAVAARVDEPYGPAKAPDADALVTDRPGIALGILTADCAPVLLADRRRAVIAVAHAGWKGALGGVLEATVAAMEQLGATRRTIAAAVGPAIARESYEVGPEFPGPFIEQSPENRDLFAPSGRSGHFLFDLPGYVARALARAGLEAIEVLARDTCAEAEAFFSYRRACLTQQEHYGRGLSAIALEG